MIFPWLYKVLPGNKVMKWVQLVVLATGVVAALMLWVFPAIDAELSVPTVESYSGISKSINLELAREGVTL
jgi:hypothetical protein